MQIGQQRGSTEGDLIDPYVFTRSVRSISNFSLSAPKFSVEKNLLKTKFVTRESNRKERDKKDDKIISGDGRSC